MRLRLDSHIFFYENIYDGNYELYDIFSVKGGPLIKIEFGKWNLEKGMNLIQNMNRWDRRTNLEGAIVLQKMLCMQALPKTNTEK